VKICYGRATVIENESWFRPLVLLGRFS